MQIQVSAEPYNDESGRPRPVFRTTPYPSPRDQESSPTRSREAPDVQIQVFAEYTEPCIDEYGFPRPVFRTTPLPSPRDRDQVSAEYTVLCADEGGCPRLVFRTTQFPSPREHEHDALPRPNRVEPNFVRKMVSCYFYYRAALQWVAPTLGGRAKRMKIGSRRSVARHHLHDALPRPNRVELRKQDGVVLLFTHPRRHATNLSPPLSLPFPPSLSVAVAATKKTISAERLGSLLK